MSAAALPPHVPDRPRIRSRRNAKYLSVWRWWPGGSRRPLIYRYPWEEVDHSAANSDHATMNWMYTSYKVNIPWWRWPNWGMLAWSTWRLVTGQGAGVGSGIAMKYSTIQPGGIEVPFTPASGRTPTLREMQDVVGGNIERVPLKRGLRGDLWVNDEGRLNGMAVNLEATKLARPDYLWAGPIFGPVLVVRRGKA